MDRSSGRKFSYLGYEFEAPWTEVKNERKGESIVILDFKGGQVISILRGADELGVMRQEAAKRGADIASVFGDQATSSSYALRSKTLCLTPRDLRLFSSPKEMVAKSVLLTLKGIWITRANGELYSFQTAWTRGFQEGSPTQDSMVSIQAFDEQDREIQLLIGAETEANGKPSQAEINRILYSLRPDPRT